MMNDMPDETEIEGQSAPGRFFFFKYIDAKKGKTYTTIIKSMDAMAAWSKLVKDTGGADNISILDMKLVS